MLSNCAGLSGRSLTEAQDQHASGFRYYDSSPYLLVYTDNAGSLNSELKYMPDLTKKREVRPYQFLASNAGTLGFDDGILSGAKTEGDGTAVPVAVIGALEKAAKAAIAADARTGAPAPAATPGPAIAPPVYLFKIVVERDASGSPVWSLKGSSGKIIHS